MPLSENATVNPINLMMARRLNHGLTACGYVMQRDPFTVTLYALSLRSLYRQLLILLHSWCVVSVFTGNECRSFASNVLSKSPEDLTTQLLGVAIGGERVLR